MQHNFLQNVRRIIAISFDKSNGTFVRLGRCSRLILKYVFCFLLDMDDGCEIFVETCSYIGQCVVKLFMDDKKFFNEETLFNGQMLLENVNVNLILIMLPYFSLQQTMFFKKKIPEFAKWGLGTLLQWMLKVLHFL
jgi:hypothetical protein